ncbi:unnamed protein product [Linum trigynum]|uniref:F-box domain-containing protein n=1 Tax=Linum trigynum TaxID=586398 RepID=A0AAV2EKJ9_9ROSI
MNMNNNNNSRSNCDSGGTVKTRRQDGTADTDRLSHLPEPIIHHILSFLDTKAAVQTSVLSRVWRFAWKHVPALHFRSDSFEQHSSFQERKMLRILPSCMAQSWTGTSRVWSCVVLQSTVDFYLQIFRLLTTLYLKNCPLAPDQDGGSDPFLWLVHV